MEQHDTKYTSELLKIRHTLRTKSQTMELIDKNLTPQYIPDLLKERKDHKNLNRKQANHEIDYFINY